MYHIGSFFQNTSVFQNIKRRAGMAMCGVFALPSIAFAECVIDGTTDPDCRIIQQPGTPTDIRSHTVRMTTDTPGQKDGGGVVENLTMSGAICGYERVLERVAEHISEVRTAQLEIKRRHNLGESYESILDNPEYSQLIDRAKIWRNKDEFDQPFPVPAAGVNANPTIKVEDNALTTTHDYTQGYTNYRKNPYARFGPAYSGLAAQAFASKNIDTSFLYTFPFPPGWTSETELVLQGCMTREDWDHMNDRLIETATNFVTELDEETNTSGDTP